MNIIEKWWNNYKRRQIAKVFKKAKGYLAQDSYDADVLNMPEHICHAIFLTGSFFHVSAKEIITKRLAGYYTVCEYLEDNGVEYSFESLQQYRHAWLDSLIAEFEAAE